MTTPTTPTPALAAFLADFNPDCYIDINEFTAPMAQLSAIGSDQSQPKVDRDITHELTMYCVWKRSAMRCRLSGHITLALEHEDKCDRIYSRLPESARW